MQDYSNITEAQRDEAEATLDFIHTLSQQLATERARGAKLLEAAKLCEAALAPSVLRDQWLREDGPMSSILRAAIAAYGE